MQVEHGANLGDRPLALHRAVQCGLNDDPSGRGASKEGDGATRQPARHRLAAQRREMDVDGGRGERDGGEAAEADAARGGQEACSGARHCVSAVSRLRGGARRGQEAEEPARVKVEEGDDPDDDGCLGGGSERVGADEVEAAEVTEDPGDGEDDEAGRLAHLERPDPKQPRACSQLLRWREARSSAPSGPEAGQARAPRGRSCHAAERARPTSERPRHTVDVRWCAMFIQRITPAMAVVPAAGSSETSASCLRTVTWKGDSLTAPERRARIHCWTWTAAARQRTKRRLLALARAAAWAMTAAACSTAEMGERRPTVASAKSCFSAASSLLAVLSADERSPSRRPMVEARERRPAECECERDEEERRLE